MKIESCRNVRACVLAALGIAVIPLVALADNDRGWGGDEDWRGGDSLRPGNLLVSRTVYDNNSANVKTGEILPPDCAASSGGCSAPSGAPYDGSYPTVFNNDL